MSSGRRRRVVMDVNWVEENFVQHIIGECATLFPNLRNAVDKFEKGKQNTPLPILASESLTPNQAMKIFGLVYQEDYNYDFEQKELFIVPTELEVLFRKYESVVGEVDCLNEALSRCFINLLIFQCVLDERIIMQDMLTQHALIESFSTPFTSKKKSNETPLLVSFETSAAEISLFVETELRQEVMFKGKSCMLAGIADYSLGYMDGTMSGNLVVVGAKRRYQMGDAYGQLISYMAMIHRSRKNDKKENSTVFGVATDGVLWHFWRINNDSKISDSTIYSWGKTNQRKHVYSILRVLIRAAILSTPTTSPIKGNEFRKAFDSDHTKLDFGIGLKWQEIFTTDDDPEVDVLEMDL